MNNKRKSQYSNTDDKKETKRTNSKRRKDYARNGGKNTKPAKSDHSFSTEKVEDPNNNPAWYFQNEKLAEQVTQMSFQNLAGYPINYDSFKFDVPNVIRIHLNPSPGVQLSANYNTGLAQKSGINMAAFRLYSKLSAFTGRTQSYAPQDVATMILALGEIISITEHIRRVFGVAYTMNMRNRDYPATILETGMNVDSSDLFQNYADYRTKFNAIITLINQLPIPKNIAYFDKCASLYENIFLDSPSSMAQTLIPVPNSTWLLDEQSYSGGTILRTIPFVCNTAWSVYNLTPQPLSVYLNILEGMVSACLNASTLHYVFMDIINYAAKQNTEFWKMDFLYDGYTVLPQYSVNFLLQMHNATVAGAPVLETNFVTSPRVCTPLNDVYPDPNKNALYYNPAFGAIGLTPNGKGRTGDEALIDMLSEEVTLTDRVDVTRYISISKGTPYQPTGQTGNVAYIDTALPDHYCVGIFFGVQTNNLTYNYTETSIIGNNVFGDVSSLVANVDWAPRFYEWDRNNSAYTGRYTSDVNFYTIVDDEYIRRLHDFVSLALYDLR